MTDVARQVQKFHKMLPDETWRSLSLRRRLLTEEFDELEGQIAVAQVHNRFGEPIPTVVLEGIAQESADLVFVTFALCEALGIDLDVALGEVCAANLRKRGGDVVAGKLTKPVGWVPPDMSGAVA